MKDIIRMNQLAGIITEGQARKMLEVLNEGNVNLGALNILPGVEKFAPYYLQKINKELTGTTPREFLKWSMRGHTIKDGEDTLKIAKQSGTWDDYSDEDLAKIDLGLNFNTYWEEEGTKVSKSDVDLYISDSLDNLPDNDDFFK